MRESRYVHTHTFSAIGNILLLLVDSFLLLLLLLLLLSSQFRSQILKCCFGKLIKFCPPPPLIVIMQRKVHRGSCLLSATFLASSSLFLSGLYYERRIERLLLSNGDSPFRLPSLASPSSGSLYQVERERERERKRERERSWPKLIDSCWLACC